MILQPVLAGCYASLAMTLLIYFKQKPVFHHSVLLVLVTSFYGAARWWRPKLHLSNLSQKFAVLTLICVCWLGPILLYIARPQTFYISGLAMATILLVLFVEEITLKRADHSFFRDLLLFLSAYFASSLLDVSYLQLTVIVLSSLYMVGVLISQPPFKINILAGAATIVILFMIFRQFSLPLVLYPSQREYEDKVLFEAHTQFHDLVITQWKDDYWFYIDRLKNFSSIDEYLYSEPMVHSAFEIRGDTKNALVLGGENGCLLREILKYPVRQVDIVSYDTLLRNLAIQNQYITKVNQHAYDHQKVHIIHENILDFCKSTQRKYDAVLIDLPDPRSVETNQFYTLEFYNLIRGLLNTDGIMITQAGSPLFATRAFYTIQSTLKKAGFNTLPLHNQILTLGEWGWLICSPSISAEAMKQKIVACKNIPQPTKWFNPEAASMITSFGKVQFDTTHQAVNSISNPLVYRYYLKGTWDLN